MKSKCNSINRKTKIKFFITVTKGGMMPNKKFWKTVKPFLTGKGKFSSDFINIEINGNLASDD